MNEIPTKVKPRAKAKPLVLVVDDDRTMRSLLNLAMEEEGYQVLEAENGEQCLSEYAHFQPDLILLDAIMPDIDGFRCCQKIRCLPEGERIPILMVTVLDDQDSVEQAFHAGATDYITKPIHWSVLSQRVRRLLEDNQTWIDLKQIETQLSQQQTWSKLISQVLEQLVGNSNQQEAIQQALLVIQQKLKAEVVCFESVVRLPDRQPLTRQYTTAINFSAPDVNLLAEYGEQYQKGQVIVVEDLAGAKVPLVVSQQLQQSNIQSLLVITISKEQKLLGSLMIYFSQQWIDDLELNYTQLLDLGKLLLLSIS